MPKFPRLRGRSKLATGASQPAGHAERPLRVLAILSVLIPVVLFAIAGWLSYHSHFDQARERLGRTVDLVHEHATKVFDTFELSERYLAELLDGLSDDEIRAQEESLSRRMRAVIVKFPQLRDLWAIDVNGRPLVSGTVYPMPRNLDLSDREYFKYHVSGDASTYISEVVEARVANTNFFAITRKRLTPEGKFAGVYLVSIAPEYFTEFYSRLPASEATVAALIRSDGSLLARYPMIEQMPRQVPGSSFIAAATRNNSDSGSTRLVSPIDGVERLLTYRGIGKNGAFVAVGIEVGKVQRQWAEAMASHLVFGLPATAAMFALAMMALTRTRHEARVQTQLNEETARRHSTELALQQAQKMEAVGQLTGGVAHDFNNLLTIIGGNLDTMRRRIERAPTTEAVANLVASLAQPLERAISGSQSAAQLTHRLLAFSRRQALKPERLDLNNLVSDISELLRRTLGERVSIETVLAGGLWATFADRNQLENALLNLAINARDAMPDGGRLTIETANTYLDEAYAREFSDIAAGQYVMISVADTGTGMSPEVIEKVFEPFFTTKGVGQGSGLGLAMVHGFVKQSGGHVRIYSEVGEGTTVKIYLPRMSKADQASVAPAVVEASESFSTEGTETVLLVEDNDGVRNYASAALQEMGYRVLSAPDAAEALEIVERSPGIDILFTDVVLPGDMNGRQLANKILEAKPGLPVLFTTGYTRNAIIHHGRLDADVHLLGKPYTHKDLARKLRELLDSRKQAVKAL